MIATNEAAKTAFNNKLAKLIAEHAIVDAHHRSAVAEANEAFLELAQINARIRDFVLESRDEPIETPLYLICGRALIVVTEECDNFAVTIAPAEFIEP